AIAIDKRWKDTSDSGLGALLIFVCLHHTAFKVLKVISHRLVYSPEFFRLSLFKRYKTYRRIRRILRMNFYRLCFSLRAGRRPAFILHRLNQVYHLEWLLV